MQPITTHYLFHHAEQICPENKTYQVRLIKMHPRTEWLVHTCACESLAAKEMIPYVFWHKDARVVYNGDALDPDLDLRTLNKEDEITLYILEKLKPIGWKIVRGRTLYSEKHSLENTES